MRRGRKGEREEEGGGKRRERRGRREGEGKERSGKRERVEEESGEEEEEESATDHRMAEGQWVGHSVEVPWESSQGPGLGAQCSVPRGQPRRQGRTRREAGTCSTEKVPPTPTHSPTAALCPGSAGGPLSTPCQSY